MFECVCKNTYTSKRTEPQKRDGSTGHTQFNNVIL